MQRMTIDNLNDSQTLETDDYEYWLKQVFEAGLVTEASETRVYACDTYGGLYYGVWFDGECGVLYSNYATSQKAFNKIVL